MFCPKCKSEYVEFVTVAATNNCFIIPIAKSILDSVGIKYFMKGEELRFMPGIIGPVEIQVPSTDAELAKEVLKDIDL